MPKFYEERRRIIIRDMSPNDIQKFYMQFFDWTDDQKKVAARTTQKRIKDISKKKMKGIKILLVTDNSGSKMIAKLETEDLNEKCTKLNIEIPNECLTTNYGYEVLDQFIKICTEKKLYSEIYVEKECPIVANYIQKRNLQIENVINIA